MTFYHEGLADPTCVVFSYLLPRDQAALRSTSRTFVQRFNRAVWYGCGIPYAGCETVFKTLEEAEEANETGCRWAPVALLRDDHQQRHDFEGGTLLMDISYGGATCSLEANHCCQLLSDRSAANLMRFKSVIVIPSATASSVRSLKLLESSPETMYLRSPTQWLDLRAFVHVEALTCQSLTHSRVSSLDFLNHLPRLVSIGNNIAYSSSLVGEVHLCDLQNLETIGSSVLYHSPNIEKVILENLPRLQLMGQHFCGCCCSLKVFAAKNLPVLEEIGGGMLGDCENLESVSFAGCPNLRTIGNEFLHRSGRSTLVVDLSGLPSLISAPSRLLLRSGIKKLRFIAGPNLKDLGSCFLMRCSHLNLIHFENTERITSFGDFWMAHCTSFESMSFELFPSLTSVGSGWLSQCRFLKRVDLSSLKKLQTIGDDAFKDSLALEACCLNGLSNLSSIGGGFLHGTQPCSLDVHGCRALVCVGVTTDDKTRRRLKAIKGAKDLPPPLRAVLEESVIRSSCSAM